MRGPSTHHGSAVIKPQLHKDVRLSESQNAKPLTLRQVAEKLGWKYHTTLRHFEKIEGVIIKPGKKKRKITVPVPVFEKARADMTTRKSAVELADEKMRQSRYEKRHGK